MKFFFPKQDIFFDLLKELSGHVKEIALLFEEFSRSFEKSEKYSKIAKEIEHRADKKTHEIIRKINETFVTPFDREDIYHLGHEMDDIIDIIENIIHSIDLYQIKEKKDFIDEFAELFIKSSKDLGKLIGNLEKQKYTSGVNNLIVSLHDLEDEGDLVFQRSIRKLFEEEKDAISIIKWKEILVNLERTMDKFQTVSDIIEAIIVKSS